MTEAIIAVPFLTFLTVAVLEFGSIFWQRQQIETGLRDAARYMSRCRPVSVTYTPTCNLATARNIAFYGTSNPSAGAVLRVPGWGPAAGALAISAPDANGMFTVSTSHVYLDSPLFGFLSIPDITINATHRQRYLGW